MTHTTHGQAAPRQLLEDDRHGTRDTDRVLLELQADVHSLVDEGLPLTQSADNGGAGAPPTGRNDRLGRRLRRSVMFADAKES